MASRCCCGSGGGGQGVTCDQVPNCVEVFAKQGAGPGDGGVTVTGSGSKTDPYIIGLNCADTRSCINITDGDDPYIHLTGTGSAGDPWTLSSDIKLTEGKDSLITVKGAGTRADPWVLELDCDTVAQCTPLPAVQSPIAIVGEGTPEDPFAIGLDCKAAAECIPATPTALTVPGAPDPLQLSGTGTTADPYVLSASCDLIRDCAAGSTVVQAADAKTTVTGDGTPASPYLVGVDCEQIAACLPPLMHDNQSLAYTAAGINLNGITAQEVEPTTRKWDDLEWLVGGKIIVPIDCRIVVAARVSYGFAPPLEFRVGVRGIPASGTPWLSTARFYSPALLMTTISAFEYANILQVAAGTQLKVYAMASSAITVDCELGLVFLKPGLGS